MTNPSFPGLLQGFFAQRLIAQRQVGQDTIASYRDTFRLLPQFAQKRLQKCPSILALADLDSTLIGTLLDDLEKERGSRARTRNLRLAAMRSFFRWAAYEDPAHSRYFQRP